MLLLTSPYMFGRFVIDRPMRRMRVASGDNRQPNRFATKSTLSETAPFTKPLKVAAEVSLNGMARAPGPSRGLPAFRCDLRCGRS